MTMARPRFCMSLALAAILWLSAALRAFPQQQHGQVRLEVRDLTGTGVAARGEILSQGNNFRRVFQVPGDGNYLLQDLPFGVYRLSLQAEGFAAWSDVVEDHSIVPVKVEVSLGVAPVTTKVQVTDEKTLVDPTATGSLFSIGHQAIQENLSSARPGSPGPDRFTTGLAI